MLKYQATIRNKASFEGVGLHSGLQTRVIVKPAKAGSGIIFTRTDVKNPTPVKASAKKVDSTNLCTSIGDGQGKIATIEHLMAAFSILGIENAIVLVDGPELPILDGSAKPFIEKLLAAGKQIQRELAPCYLITKRFEYTVGDQSIVLSPAAKTSISCQIDYPTPVIGRQSLKLDWTKKSLLKVSASRTFCHFDDIEKMRKAGLAQGGSLDNAIVVTDTGVLNDDGLRNELEFVGHKILDFVGDFSLFGGALLGRIDVKKPGHSLNVAFVKELLNQQHDVLERVDHTSPKELDFPLFNLQASHY